MIPAAALIPVKDAQARVLAQVDRVVPPEILPLTSALGRVVAEDVRATVKALHPYTVPAILVLPIEGGEPGYLDWLMRETEPRPSS